MRGVWRAGYGLIAIYSMYTVCTAVDEGHGKPTLEDFGGDGMIKLRRISEK